MIRWITGSPAISNQARAADSTADTASGAPARDVIEVDGAKLFFPDERPGDLVPHLRRLWGR
jgi:hypothetical protein